MAKGRAYTQEQIAKIISDYVETHNVQEVCRRCKCSTKTVEKYLKSDYGKELYQEFTQAKKEIVSQTWKEYFEEHRQDWLHAVDVYMEHLMQPEVIATANARDTMTILGILNDKLTREVQNITTEDKDDGSGVAILPAVLPDEDDPGTKGGD